MKEFKALYDTIVKLRSPGGCSWDQEQTPQSLRGALIEETYECLEAIDEGDSAHIEEELGDLYLLVTMLAYMHEQEGKFSAADALQKVNEKLIRRHPHVFGDVKVNNVNEILDNWAKIKVEQEGRKQKDSLMDEVSSGMPPMDRAYKLQKKAAKAGFDWPDTEGVVLKIKEELGEVQDQIIYNGEQRAEKLEEELGDLLFSVINLCRFLKIEPSAALRRTNSKFVDRFKYVEKKMKEFNYELNKENLNKMDKFWNEAKEIKYG
ncbi:MAG: nucleoside triphosphate pyrophosphohydrolase [Treponema sp.]|jgi:tetrapyrrole methylase family protein/MazG family protein|nr:nucleoside triphosphate pyrophosphohydrolase [Treponema sp.]